MTAGSDGARMGRIAAPLALVVALLAIWEVLAQTGILADGLGLDSFLVPAPSEIATSLWENRSLLADNAWVTIREVFAGFAVALLVGVTLAAALHLSPVLRRALYPLIVASQTVPIVVVAPIFVVWFGFGIGPKVAVIALICFFPIVVNALDGLATTEPDQRKLMRSLGADRLRTFRELEAPTALPFLISGAKIAVAVAVIGAVFGEWAGSDSGLGHLMLLDNGQLEVARLFASVVVLSAIAIALFGLLSLAERRIAWWGEVVRRARLAAASTVLVAVVLLAAGCGGESAGGAEPFDLTLDFYVNPDHVGIYEALDEGLFDDAGLDVTPHVPSDPSAPIKQVASGQVDLAVSYEPEVILARDQGLDVVAVAALVNGPLTSVISLPAAGIEGPSDLAGKTVVTAGIPYQTAYLQTILRKAGVDPGSVKQVDVGFNLLQPLLAGRADAMLGGFLNVEGVDLAERGENPTVVPVDQLGIPTYDELVLVADADRLREDPGPIRDFIAALAQGTADARADPAGATDALLKAAPDLDPDLTRAEVDKTLPLLGPERGKPYGYMDPGEWEHFAGFLAAQGQIGSAPRADEMLDDGLLPKG